MKLRRPFNGESSDTELAFSVPLMPQFHFTDNIDSVGLKKILNEIADAVLVQMPDTDERKKQIKHWQTNREKFFIDMLGMLPQEMPDEQSVEDAKKLSLALQSIRALFPETDSRFLSKKNRR